MQLLAAWRDSLTLLLPKNFVLLAGAIFLAIGRTYRAWLGTWWWLIALVCGMFWLYGLHARILFHEANIFTVLSLVGFPFLKMPSTVELSQENLMHGISSILLMLALFLLYVSARPAVAPKQYDYFFGFMRYFPLFIGLLFAMRVVPFLMSGVVGSAVILCMFPYFLIAMVNHSISDCLVRILGIPCFWLIFGIAVVPCIALSALSVFFLLDSPGSLRDMLRSIVCSMKMVILNFPLLMVMVGGILCAMLLVASMCSLILHWLLVDSEIALFLLNVVYLLTLPIPVTLLCVVYIKRLYDNSAVYLE